MANIKNIDKIIHFVAANDLDFSGTDSTLNSNCVPLAGYAAYLGVDRLSKKFRDFFPTPEAEKEFRRVWEYARTEGYGGYWRTEEAKKAYNFIER